IAIAAALGSGVSNAIVALSVVLIAPIARVVETEVVSLRGQDFMDAARVSGAGWIRIAVRQVLPNIAPSIAVYCTALVGLSLVSVRDLTVSFRTRRGSLGAVRGVTFSIAPSETLVLLGESGSGKSVTARALMRLHPSRTAIGGEVVVDGRSIFDLDERAMRDV